MEEVDWGGDCGCGDCYFPIVKFVVHNGRMERNGQSGQGTVTLPGRFFRFILSSEPCCEILFSQQGSDHFIILTDTFVGVHIAV